MVIVNAAEKDLPEILKLQYLSYQSEAKLFKNRDIPPLKQTLEELRNEYEKGTVLEAIDDDGSILGSVRAYEDKGTVYVGKLFVRPDSRGKGIGSMLLAEIERACPADRYELFTSARSTCNIRLYSRLGYKRFKEKTVSDELSFVYMEKIRCRG